MAKYNLTTERKIKDATYRTLVRAELVDELYEQILQKLVVEKKYRDPKYNAQVLAKELNTNSRYISAVVNLRFNMNYSCLVNEYRIRESQYLLIDKRYADKTIEEISAMVGFANRQSFYASFYKIMGVTPREYRLTHLAQHPSLKKNAKGSSKK